MRPPHAALPRATSALLRAVTLLVWSALLLAGDTSAWAAPQAAPPPSGSPAKLRPASRKLPNAAAAPAAPSDLNLYTYPTPNSIELYWTSNSSNENSFSVERKVDGQPDTAFTPVGSADPVDSVGAQVFFTDPSPLSFDTVYDYRVRAIAADGTPSDYSNTATGTTAPVKPISLSVSAVSGSDSQLLLSWADDARHTVRFYVWRKGPGQAAFTNIGYTLSNGSNGFYEYGVGYNPSTGTPGKGDALTVTDTGLTVHSAYSYYVTAVNGAGQSDPSATAAGTTNTTQAAPVAPSLGASAGSSGSDGTADPKTTIEVYGTDNSTNAASVTLQRVNADVAGSTYASLPGFPKPITGGVGTQYIYYDAGLAVDTSYSYRAYASNVKGDSPYSDIATAATVPVKPVSVSVASVAGSDSQLLLSWVDDARHTVRFYVWRKGPGQAAFTNIGYTLSNGSNGFYEYGVGYNPSTGTPGKGDALTVTDTGLTVHSAYSYYVTAVNGAGQSDPSDTVTATTFPSTPPGAPTDLQATSAANPSQINLNWLDHSTDEYGFIVEREAETETSFTALPGAKPGDPTVGPSPGTGRVYYSDKAVTDDTAYTYRVKATNPAGDSAYSNSITATTAPTAVTGLGAAAVAGTNDSLKLAWTSSSKHEDGFNVYRKGPSDTVFSRVTSAPPAAGPGSAVTLIQTGLSASTSYSYYVTAYNTAGESAASSTVSATTGAVLPTTVTITSPADGAKFNVGVSIPVLVTAVPAVGTTITSYTLITDGVSVTQATGSFTLTGLAAGTHILKANALDSAGNTASFPGIAISVVNQPPAVTNAKVAPTTLPAGGGALTVSATVTDPNGVGLSSVSASLLLNGAALTAINLSNGGSGSAYSGTYTVPANASGTSNVYTAQVTAQNAAALTTTVNAAGSCTQSSGNPVPAITSLSPTSAAINSTGQVLTVNGTGFVAGITVTFGAGTGLVPVAGSRTSTQLQVVLPDSALTTAGPVSVTVSNPAPAGGTSNALSFTLVVPTPVAPVLQAAAAGDGQVSLTCTTVANALTYHLKSAASAAGPFTTDVAGVTASAGAATVTATDPGQTNGVQKFYAVSAVGTGGESPNSNALSATPVHVNVPPTITLTSPADGTTQTAPGAVTLTATASDPDGTVTQVEFFQNDVSVGVVTASPYTLPVSGLVVGTYTFKAVATDNAGATTASSVAAVTIANPAVGVTILSGPADQAAVCANTVIFTWTGYSPTTPVAQLRYEHQIDNSATWSAPAPETTYTLTGLTEGLHSFAIRLLDADGSIVGSPVGRSFFVNLTPPTLLSSTVPARDTRVTISWITSKPTTGQIEYGKTTAYGQNAPADSVPDGAHQTTVAGLTTQTTYHYRIHFTDGCHDVVSSDQTFTTTVLLKPNLQISAATVPPSFAPLETIPVAWTVLNVGPGDADNNWTDTVYLAKSNVLDVTAVKLGDFPSASPLNQFAAYTQNQSLTIPRTPAGNYYLIIKANTTNTLPETDITDNTLAIPVTVTALQNMVVSPGTPFLSLHVGQTVTGTLTLTDLSLDAEAAITATVTGLPANVTLTVTPPTSLLSLQSGTVQYAVTAKDATTLNAAPIIHLKSASGDEAVATLTLTVIPPTPLLTVTPITLQTSMVRGGQRLVDFTVTNNGDATATGLKLSLPNAPWLSLPSANPAGDLAPGATGTFELALTPAADLPLGAYTGSIGLNGTNAGVSIPFAFNCISSAIGDLKVVAQDEFSFFADTHPNVAGAHVVLTDSTTGAVVVNGVTGSDGVLTKTGVPEGNYNVDVTADNHSPYHGQYSVVAGEPNEIDPFLSRQLVTYTWTVFPVPFTDQYTVTLDATFETHVPAPIVTASPENLDLTKVAYDANGKAIVNYTLTNHGFIAALDTSFNISSNSHYTITPVLTSLGTIPAMSSIIVPVTIKRLSASVSTPHTGSRATKAVSHPGATCDDAIAGIVIWHYICGGTQTRSGRVVLYGAGSLAIGGCLLLEIGELFGGGGGGGGGDYGGYGGGGVVYDVGPVGGGNTNTGCVAALPPGTE